jgi:hypothetical protein
VSSPVMHLDLLLKLPPDEVLFDFLAQCGLTLHAVDDASDGNVYEKLRIAIAIELAPEPIRDAVVASLRDVALLADAEGLEALRTVSKRAPGRVNPLHLADAPAQCALWIYLRHRDLFDAAVRLRGLRPEVRESLSLESVRAPLAAPDDLVVNSVRLCEATLLDEATGGEIAVRAPACDSSLSVLDLLSVWMPIENPMQQDRFRVVAATLDIELYPEPGQSSGRSVTLNLKRRGGGNLEAFDARTRSRLETWLNQWRLQPSPHSGHSPTCL